MFFYFLALLLFACLVWLINQNITIEQARNRYPRTQALDRQDSEKCNQIAKRLYRQMHGDKRAIERLFVNAYRKNPDKSELWVWEKIEFDLDRDRQ